MSQLVKNATWFLLDKVENLSPFLINFGIIVHNVKVVNLISEYICQRITFIRGLI